MTEPQPVPLSPSAQRRLDEHRRRRAAMAADRAAFEERRRYGLKSRHAAKLAYLAERDSQPEKEPPETDDQRADAA